MNRKLIASSLLRCAKALIGMEFDTKEELAAYLKEHPGADKSKHSVKNEGGSKSVDVPGEGKKKTSIVRTKTLRKVQNILNAHDIEPDSTELNEMAGFKKTLGQRVPEADKGKWFVRNESQLKAAFLKNMKPGNYDSPEDFQRAKKRIQEMPVADFGKVLAAINDDDIE